MPLPQRPDVWRPRELAVATRTLPSGHAALCAQLPGGGWPLDGLVEVLQARPEPHVWQLLLPALAQATRQQAGPVVLVGAPLEPFGPALAARGLAGDRLLCVHADAPAALLWAAEQALRCAEVAAVVAWLPRARSPQLRRLQLAAQKHQRPAFVLRGLQAQHESSPAALRLRLEAGEGDALQVRILKRRGPPLDAPVLLPAHPAALQALLAARRGKPLPAPATATAPAPAPAPAMVSAPVPAMAPGQAVHEQTRVPHALDRAPTLP